MSATLIDQVLHRLVTYPDKPCVTLITHNDEYTLTYREFFDRAARYASMLKMAGLQTGDLVVLVLQHGEAVMCGFWGALLISECGTSLDEYKRFMEIAVDEAKGRHHFLIQGVFDTPAQVLAMAKAGEAIGVSGILLGQPNSFYPTTEDELFEYLSGVANKIDLAVCMFCTTQMNFSRFHTSGYPQGVIEKVAALQNVVAVKYEVGRPGVPQGEHG